MVPAGLRIDDPIPQEMTALVLKQYGPLETGLSLSKINVPLISPHQILVHIHAAGINPHDYKQALGELQKHEPLTLPAQVGADFSGTIVRIGDKVADYAVGDRVFGLCSGSIAEYCVVSPGDIVPLPSNAQFEQAASLPVVGMTTLQAFRRIGGIKLGDRVLIHAGTGGVGSFAIQYAKSQGAYVFTTASKENADMLHDLGADEVIDYRTESYQDICTNLDIVLDTLGGDHTFDAFKILKPGGRVVSIVPAEINTFVAKEFDLPKIAKFFIALRSSRVKRLMKSHNAGYAFVFMRPDIRDLDTLANLVESRAVSSVIDQVFTLDRAIDALRYLAGKRAKGKVVIRTPNT